jgi:hypothetical protein
MFDKKQFHLAKNRFYKGIILYKKYKGLKLTNDD